MDGLVAYVLAKKIALGAVSGISAIRIENTNLIFDFNNGSSASMSIPIPKDGIDGITPHIDPVTKHWVIGFEDTEILAEGKDGKDGISVVDIKINENEHLIVTLSNGQILDAGAIPKNQSQEKNSSIVFFSKEEELPEIGKEDTLYITDNSIFRYYDNKYNNLTSQYNKYVQWEDF